jgi:hypothetical protein
MELLIVFGGVYGAFVVDNYREDITKRQRTQQLYAGLMTEFTNMTEHGAMVVGFMQKTLRDWKGEYDRGGMPAPAYFREPLAERPPTAAWDAVRSSGGLELIDANLFFRLAIYYNRIQSLGERYQRYNAFTEQELLPKLHGPVSLFYDRQSGKVRGEFLEHMERLEELAETLQSVVTEADSLRSQVRQRQE